MSTSLRSLVPKGARQVSPGSGRFAMSERHAARHDRHAQLEPNGPSELVEQGSLSGCWGWSGSRLGRHRGVAGLVAVCVLTLGVAACSAKDAKAEASASASAAVARAEKGIADAKASATASREAALTPELRAKRDAALAEPAPEKPEQMNDQTREGATLTAWYFLELYRATKLHQNGGWADKWDQEITNYTYYEKIEGYDYNELDVTVSQGQVVSHPGGGKEPTTSNPEENQVLDFAVRYNGSRWMIGEVEVIKK